MTTPPLTANDRRGLLALARETIAAASAREPLPLRPANLSRVCDELRGVFVSLHIEGALRGCVGLIAASRPLWDAVRHAAVSASQRDPRFPPVESRELPAIEIEISVLSPLTPLQSVDELQPGHHGLLVSRGDYSGLLLPQVAQRHGWDAPTFLSQTCRKAGLGADAWRDPETQIQAFTAEIFDEHAAR